MTAQQAKKQALANNAKQVFDQIHRAVGNGVLSVTITFGVSSQTLALLKQEGYTIYQTPNFTRISWG